VACTGKLGGTFSGTADLSTGAGGGIPVNVTFSGSVVLAPIASTFPSFPGVDPPTYYGVESGSMHYKASGTLVGGCHLFAEGPVDLLADPGSAQANVLTLTAGAPPTYTMTLAGPLTPTVPGAFSECPDPNQNHATSWSAGTGLPALIYAPTALPLADDGTAAGTNSGRVTGGQPQQTWVWDLHPQ
jgi:hypothetical protein